MPQKVTPVSPIQLIPDTKRHYVSEDGRVYILFSKKGWRKAGFKKTTNGYLVLEIRRNGKNKGYLVHRLVAKAFCENPENKPHVAHIDGNKENNHVSNLRWSTPQENEADKAIHGTVPCGEKHFNARFKNVQIRVVKHCLKLGVKMKLLARMLNVNYKYIQRIKSGELWKTITI